MKEELYRVTPDVSISNKGIPDLSILKEKYAPNIVSSEHRKSNSQPESIVVINTANRPWSVIDSQDLVHTFRNVQFTELYYSPSGRKFNSSDCQLDSAISEVQSQEHLLISLIKLDPSAVYLRVSPHVNSENLVSLIRLQFPSIKLFVEFYDMSLLFNAKTLDYMFGSQESLQDNQEGCRVALYYADGVVVKMGGSQFPDWASGFPAPFITYFPSVGIRLPNFPDRVNHRRQIQRVLYAGSTSSREILGGLGSVDGANTIAYFDVFKSDDMPYLDIFNAAHTSQNEDHSVKFEAILKRYEHSTNIHYHRAVSRKTLVENAKRYDAGICCTHYENDYVLNVTRFGLPNRMMTYLEAGLPVIIDNRFQYSAELINTFEAGTVIEAGNIAQFTDCLQTMNLSVAHKGVVSLVTHMVKHNVSALEQLLRIIRT